MSCNSLFGCNEAAWQSHILQRGRTRGEESGGAEKGRDLGGNSTLLGPSHLPKTRAGTPLPRASVSPLRTIPGLKLPTFARGGVGAAVKVLGACCPPPLPPHPGPGRISWEVGGALLATPVVVAAGPGLL